MNVERLAYWIRERESIRLLKEAGHPRPWTSDPILQRYKFCNVHREDDAVTRWIDQHIRQPYAKNPNLWFMLCIARQINWPDTLQELMQCGGWPIFDFDPYAFLAVLRERRSRGDKVYTGAYMIQGDITSAPGLRDKPEYTALDVLKPLWEDQVKPHSGDTLAGYHAALMTSRGKGWGSFMAGQAVADIKYTVFLRDAADWRDWAAVGPGSSRGLNRIFGREVKPLVGQKQALEEMLIVREALGEVGEGLHLQDVQNCLCELDKMERVRLGEGRPRSLYPGEREC